jgi:nucleotide-binding universal stress UspA family protein
MSITVDRDGSRRRAADPSRSRRRRGAVLLATFASAPFDPDAARLALDAAADSGAALLVVDVVEVKPGRRGPSTATDPVPAPAAALSALLERAHDLGVRVEALRVAALQPVGALLRVVLEHRPALVVFGPDRGALRRFRRPTRRAYRRFVRVLAATAPGLLWTAAR